MASGFAWKLDLVPDTARYPKLRMERIYIEDKTRLQMAYILNQIKDEFRKIYGNGVAQPTSFILKIREKDGVFARILSDDTLRQAVAEVDEQQKACRLHFEATAVYSEQVEEKDKKIVPPTESSDDDVIIESGPTKSEAKVNKKRKRTSDGSPQASSSTSSDNAQPPGPSPKEESISRPQKTPAKQKPAGKRPRKSLATRAARKAPSNGRRTSRTVTVHMSNNRKSASSQPSEVEAEGLEPDSSPSPPPSPEIPAACWARSIVAKSQQVVINPVDTSSDQRRLARSRAGARAVVTPVCSDDGGSSAISDGEPAECGNSLPTKPLPKKAAPRKQSKPSVAAKKAPARTDQTKKRTAEARGLKSKSKKKGSSGRESLKTTVPSLNTSVWLRHTLPLRLPYCPQVGDRVYYYPWTHKLVYECIKKRRLATHKGVSEEAQQPWSTQQNLGFNTADHTKELFVVRSIKYEIITPRIKSSNRLAILELDSLERTPRISITIHYQDVPGEDVFLVLKQLYDKGVKMYDAADFGRKLLNKRARAIFWNHGGLVARWENGVISSVVDPRIAWQSVKFTWDTSAVGPDKLSSWFSSWEVFLINTPEPPTSALVTKEDILRDAYVLEPEDWADEEPNVFTARVLSVLEEMLDPDFGMAAGFKTPVDLGDQYQEKVAYPVYLELIKERLANGVYRRKEALNFDIEHLASTVEGCGGFTNDVVRARIVQDILLETIRDQSIVELSAELVKKHQVAHDVKQVKVEQQGTKMSVCSSSTRPKAPAQHPPRKMAQPGLRTFGCFH